MRKPNRESSFASALRAERGRLDLSQSELAKLVGVDIASIQNWENGEYMPTLSTTVKLADVLGVSIDQLAGRTVE